MAPSVLQTTKIFSHMSIQSFVLSTLGNLFTLYPNLESPVNLTRAHEHTGMRTAYLFKLIAVWGHHFVLSKAPGSHKYVILGDFLVEKFF